MVVMKQAVAVASLVCWSVFYISQELRLQPLSAPSFIQLRGQQQLWLLEGSVSYHIGILLKDTT